MKTQQTTLLRAAIKVQVSSELRERPHPYHDDRNSALELVKLIKAEKTGENILGAMYI